MVFPTGIEPVSTPSEGVILSVELRELIGLNGLKEKVS